MSFVKYKDLTIAICQNTAMTDNEKRMVEWHMYNLGQQFGAYLQAQHLDTEYAVAAFETWAKENNHDINPDFLGGIIDSGDKRNAYAEYADES